MLRILVDIQRKQRNGANDMKITPKQLKTIKEMDGSQAFGTVIHKNLMDTGRLRITLSAGKNFTFHLFIGKRGKIYENE